VAGIIKGCSAPVLVTSKEAMIERCPMLFRPGSCGREIRGHGCLTVLVALWFFPQVAYSFPGFIRRVDTWEDWESIALNSSGIKHVVPGPSPIPGPAGELVPGDPALPCLDFVLYGPGIQHIDIIRSTGLDCVADFTGSKMNEMRLSMTQFAGYVVRFPAPDGDGFICGVTLHNDLFVGPPVISPANVSYVMRQLRLTFNEEALGRLLYLPTTVEAQERARSWLSDPSVEPDFEVWFDESEVPTMFLRGDANMDGSLGLSDAVTILRRLFVDGTTPMPCRDAADANDDGEIDIHDPMRILRHLFQGGVPPAPPFPGRGPDPTADELGDC
jgi:hypothetical protein